MKAERGDSDRIASGYPGAPRKNFFRLIFFSDLFTTVALLLI
jgi:hypothetical protein